MKCFIKIGDALFLIFGIYSSSFITLSIARIEVCRFFESFPIPLIGLKSKISAVTNATKFPLVIVLLLIKVLPIPMIRPIPIAATSRISGVVQPVRRIIFISSWKAFLRCFFNLFI